jgi:hypothetical protein
VGSGTTVRGDMADITDRASPGEDLRLDWAEEEAAAR